MERGKVLRNEGTLQQWKSETKMRQINRKLSLAWETTANSGKKIAQFHIKSVGGVNQLTRDN